MRVLLVDDEKELVSALAERLGFRGIEADWATSGEQALEMSKSTKYDAAVLDVKMPRIGGIKLCRLLQETMPDLKCIFLTGHGSEQDFREGVQEGEAYLVKPAKIEVLIEEIKGAVEQGE